MVLITGKEVGHTGYGMMTFSTLTTALANNVNFWNGGELYGTPDANSLHLLARFATAHPSAASRVCLSLKGAKHPTKPMTIDGSRTNIRRSINECLRVLSGTNLKISIFEPARIDPTVPLEETITAIAEYVQEGKIGGIGLSEKGACDSPHCGRGGGTEFAFPGYLDEWGCEDVWGVGDPDCGVFAAWEGVVDGDD
ncbi:MAG: hypothetical protein Q9225_001730 [Loekoesia sp. 1 TL-2023]